MPIRFSINGSGMLFNVDPKDFLSITLTSTFLDNFIPFWSLTSSTHSGFALCSWQESGSSAMDRKVWLVKLQTTSSTELSIILTKFGDTNFLLQYGSVFCSSTTWHTLTEVTEVKQWMQFSVFAALLLLCHGQFWLASIVASITIKIFTNSSPMPLKIFSTSAFLSLTYLLLIIELDTGPSLQSNH